ncbi:MAG: hypothetical protein OEV91_04670, partial [Desulfobulbaceae bacterium]|nr:hypothetical protein [Desulfobulbaceae bacterium]
MTPRDQARIFRLALFFFVPLVAIIGVVAAGLFLVRTSSESAALKDIEWQVVENLRAHLRHDLDYVASDLLYLAHREDMDKIFLADGT